MSLAALRPGPREIHHFGCALALFPLESLQDLCAWIAGPGHGKGVVAVFLGDVGVDVDFCGCEEWWCGGGIYNVVVDQPGGVSLEGLDYAVDRTGFVTPTMEE